MGDSAPNFPTPTAQSGDLEPIIRTDRTGPWLQFLYSGGFEWTHAELPIPGLPPDLQGFRILHLSDLHVRARWDEAYDELIRRVQADPPDLIIYTGDFVDDVHDHRKVLSTLRRVVNGLKSRLGSVAILGNHDGDLLGPPLASLDLTLVEHRMLTIASGSASLELIGVAGVQREDFDLAFLQTLPPKSPGAIRIALSHYPDVVRDTQFLHPDLFLAGHTHGGQVCLPGKIPIFKHDSLPRPICSGIHRAYNTWLVINRGFGFSWLAIRMFCPAEVIEIRLRSA